MLVKLTSLKRIDPGMPVGAAEISVCITYNSMCRVLSRKFLLGGGGGGGGGYGLYGRRSKILQRVHGEMYNRALFEFW